MNIQQRIGLELLIILIIALVSLNLFDWSGPTLSTTGSLATAAVQSPCDKADCGTFKEGACGGRERTDCIANQNLRIKLEQLLDRMLSGDCLNGWLNCQTAAASFDYKSMFVGFLIGAFMSLFLLVLIFHKRWEQQPIPSGTAPPPNAPTSASGRTPANADSHGTPYKTVS